MFRFAPFGQYLLRNHYTSGGNTVHRYLIERELPGAGKLSAEELAGITKTSNGVLAGMAGRAQWIESYVTDDAITCVYLADSPETIREHANAGGFPATVIREVVEVIDPTTGQS
ncbi:MAG: hypothetical protein QOE45_311 [Frankiaceae bacterium]|jgi:hypothetical protein|nr:hypothetical protein [Frankiaceae bacterium]